MSLEITGMIAERDQVVLQWTSRARTRDGRPYENGCTSGVIAWELPGDRGVDRHRE